jgi:hypothetical protein
MKIHDDIPDERLVVGVMKDSQVLTDTFAVYQIKENDFDQLITKTLAETMATSEDKNADKWLKISKAPALLGILEDGSICFVKGGLFQPSKADLH